MRYRAIRCEGRGLVHYMTDDPDLLDAILADHIRECPELNPRIVTVDITEVDNDRATRATDPAPSNEDDRITQVESIALSRGTVSAPNWEDAK